MPDLPPHRLVPETSDQGRREFTVAMQLKMHGELHMAERRFGVSLNYYKRVIAEIHFQTGDCLYKQNNWVAAAEQFRHALQLVPNHHRARNRLETCRHLVKRVAKPEE